VAGLACLLASLATVDGDVVDIPIDLPQLTSAHTAKRLTKVITITLTTYSITALKLGYFVLKNASNNDTAVTALANNELPTNKRRISEPVKPVVTRWNPFYCAFERAAQL
jgi:hypothetical protein